MSSVVIREPVERLRDAGLRITAQRRAILSALGRAQGALAPQQILEEAQKDAPQLGLATVYRTIELLEELGCVRRVAETEGGGGVALCSAMHGHHVLCSECGRVAEFSTCRLGETIDGASRETGFVISRHYLELVGLCAQCARPDRGRRT